MFLMFFVSLCHPSDVTLETYKQQETDESASLFRMDP